MSKKKIIYVVTEDWYFIAHWLPTAKMAQEMGFDVSVACRIGEQGTQAQEAITAAGMTLFPLLLKRESLNPFEELANVGELIRLFKHENPNLVHLVAIKPMLYGAIAASVAKVERVIATFAGMGFLFTQNTIKARVLRPAVSLLMRMFLNSENVQIVTQNTDDRIELTNIGIRGGRDIAVIRGVGVDVNAITPTPEPVGANGEVTFTYLGRMLGDKGVGEFIAALRDLKGRGVAVRGVLVGQPDAANPTSFSEAEINGWVAEGLVEWQGYRDDIANVWAEANVAVLPSYREGLPTSLTEAGASERALIATDVPGCREVVHHEQNGLLVPPRDSAALAVAMECLATNPEKRVRFAKAARMRVEEKFSLEVILGKSRALYK